MFSAVQMMVISTIMMWENYWVFLSMKFFMGFCIGVKIVASLRMVEEYAPAPYFPYLSNLMYASIALGMILSSSLPYSSPVNYLTHWRWTFGANLICNALMLTSLFLFIKCDSPKFYHLRGLEMMTRRAI